MTEAERLAYNRALEDAAARSRAYDSRAHIRVSYQARLRGERFPYEAKDAIALGIEALKLPEPVRVACVDVTPAAPTEDEPPLASHTQHRDQRRRPSVHIEQLTPEQEAGIRSALRELHARLGTWRAVSDAIQISERSIERVLAGRRRPTPGWALRLAPVLGVTIESVLCGALSRVPGRDTRTATGR